MSDVEEIKALGDSLGEGITFTLEACEEIKVVPKMFRKMALKTMIKAAREKGVSEIDKEFALSIQPGK